MSVRREGEEGEGRRTQIYALAIHEELLERVARGELLLGIGGVDVAIEEGHQAPSLALRVITVL